MALNQEKLCTIDQFHNCVNNNILVEVKGLSHEGTTVLPQNCWQFTPLPPANQNNFLLQHHAFLHKVLFFERPTKYRQATFIHSELKTSPSSWFGCVLNNVSVFKYDTDSLLLLIRLSHNFARKIWLLRDYVNTMREIEDSLNWQRDQLLSAHCFNWDFIFHCFEEWCKFFVCCLMLKVNCANRLFNERLNYNIALSFQICRRHITNCVMFFLI